MESRAGSMQVSVNSRIRTANYFLLATCFLISVSAFSQRSKEAKPHREDLTVHRLSFPDVRDTVIQKSEERVIEILPPSHAVNEKVNEVLDSMARFNKTKMYIDGFTIQVYSGLKREEALDAKKKMVDEARELTADLNYIQPKWRVKTGSYFTRLEAQRDLHRLRRIFPNAILIPEKVAMK